MTIDGMVEYFEAGNDDQRMLASEVRRLRERERVLVEFAESMVEWSEAYPKAIFEEPTPEQVQAVCKGLGFAIDNISAMILRIFTKPVGDRARAALEAVKE